MPYPFGQRASGYVGFGDRSMGGAVKSFMGKAKRGENGLRTVAPMGSTAVVPSGESGWASRFRASAA